MSEKTKDTNAVPEPVAGFVLLGRQSWDRKKFFRDIKREWGIELEENRKNPDLIISTTGNCAVTVAFIPKIIPNGEAERFAAGNYIWPDAVKTVKKHKAHIIVSVIGNADARERATVYTKLVSSLLAQKEALAVYSEAAVYSPEYFLDFARLVKHDEFPVMNVVWIGVYQFKEYSGVYTYGLRKFGREEMEIMVPSEDFDMNIMRQFMFGLSVYVLGTDIVLHDGETVDLADDQRFTLSLSDSVAVDGKTLKVAFSL